MNDSIANMIALKLIELPYITKACGCVRVLSTKDRKRYPISTLVHFESEEVCDQEDGYVIMAPTSQHVGVCFFEDLGVRFGKVTSSRARYLQGSLKLIVWVNLDKIGENATIEPIQESIWATLGRMKVEGLPSSVGGKVKVSQIYPKHPNAFTKYSFDEERTQFLSHPFDHFAMKLDYTCIIMQGCAPTITLTPVQC